LVPRFAVQLHRWPEVVFLEVVDVEPAAAALAWLDRSSSPLVNALLDVARDQAAAASAAPVVGPGAAST
jgi:hypothetical protein